MKIKRILMSVFGVVICGISVGMFKRAALGVDPFQSLMSGLDAVITAFFMGPPIEFFNRRIAVPFLNGSKK